MTLANVSFRSETALLMTCSVRFKNSLRVIDSLTVSRTDCLVLTPSLPVAAFVKPSSSVLLSDNPSASSRISLRAWSLSYRLPQEGLSSV